MPNNRKPHLDAVKVQCKESHEACGVWRRGVLPSLLGYLFSFCLSTDYDLSTEDPSPDRSSCACGRLCPE